MRHKGERHIPDFAPKHKPMAVPHGVAPAAKPSKPQPARPAAVKPHGTSAKSGRRGQ
jgi:hypothetical protein